VVHLPARNEVVHAFSDHSKVRAVFTPPHPLGLGEGIDRMATWVKEFGSRDPIRFRGEIEVDRNLPPSWRDIQLTGGQ
jgi:UDP-glucose 4-epimerase